VVAARQRRAGSLRLSFAEPGHLYHVHLFPGYFLDCGQFFALEPALQAHLHRRRELPAIMGRSGRISRLLEVCLQYVLFHARRAD
jgi:uncharacterized protein (AIM24 family)